MIKNVAQSYYPCIPKINGILKKINYFVNSDYNKALDESTVIKDSNTSLKMRNYIMSEVTMIKNALTGFNYKVITLTNGACVPYIDELIVNDLLTEINILLYDTCD